MRAVLLILLGAATLLAAGPSPDGVVWTLDSIGRVAGQRSTWVGAPRVEASPWGRAVRFNGVGDGIFVPVLPLEGAVQFTVEILFYPEADGPAEQRFWHAQDGKETRALIETRLDGRGGWWLDTFMTNQASGGGVTLVDPARVHPAGRWHWAALRYDGRTLAHFVNGRKELERAVDLAPFGPGTVSLGVRQNRVHWFKGLIAEVRYHRVAVPEEQLRRVP
jgi:hypothetical protein